MKNLIHFILILPAFIFGLSHQLAAQSGQSNSYTLQSQTMASVVVSPADNAGSTNYSLHQGNISGLENTTSQSNQYTHYPGMIVPEDEIISSQYCTTFLYTTGCNSGDYIDDFVLADIQNLASNCSLYGYGDFTDLSTVLQPGEVYDLTLKCGYENQRISIWIDMDDNYEFGENELLISDYILVQSDSSYTFQLTIPEEGPAGEHRLRIRSRWGNTSSLPCEQFEFGETEDYTVIFEDNSPGYCIDSLYVNGCSLGDYLNDFILEDISNTGTGCSPDGYSDYTAFSTDLSAGQVHEVTLSCGYSNQKAAIWIDLNDDLQFSVDEKILNDFDLPLAMEQYQAQIAIPPDAPEGEHRLRIRIRYYANPDDPCTQYSYGETEDYTINIQPGVENYCIENLYSEGCSLGDYIDEFILADISNVNSGCSPNGYGDFTNLSTSLSAGEMYTLSITCMYNDQYASLWIDLNNNYEFEASEKLVDNVYLEDQGQQYQTEITIPEDALEGQYRMRVRTSYNDNPTDPCEQFTYGETEDYTVVIQEASNPYCTENLYWFGCESGDGLNDFIFAGIENTSSGCSDDAYGDFTNMMASVNLGSNYELAVSSQIEKQYVTIWVDINEDFEFGDDEIILNNGYVALPGDYYYFDIEIPLDFPEGEFRMRARTNYDDSCTDACAKYSFGEVEDYTIQINPYVPHYCTENLYYNGCSEGDGLNYFILADIENTNSGCSENAYGDFTYLTTNIITGVAYPISFSSNYNSQYVTVWVDLDNNFVFDEGEIIVDNLYLEYKNVIVAGDFMLPEGTPEGTYRLRARTNFTASVNDPCETYSYGEVEDYTINVVQPIVETQSIYLSQGWNGLSSYLDPTDNSMEDIFAEVEEDLIIVQNMTDVYWPGQSINTFTGWDSNTGYQVKMNSSAWLNIHGNLIVPPLVELNEGWNMMPVYSPCMVDPDDFFAPSPDDVILVKDVAGTGVYWPGMSINTLDKMIPGKSYLALMNKNTTLNFSACSKNEEPEYHAPEIPKFNGKVVQTTSATHTIAFADGDYQFNIGDAIAAFTADGQYAGSMLWTEESRVITLFGDDPFTAEKEGFDEGGKIYFSRLDSKTGEITYPEFKINSTQFNHDGTFHENGLSVISGISTTGIKNAVGPEVVVYPNPVNDILNIKSDALILKIEVFSRQGMKIMEIEAGNTMETKLNAGQLPAGIYSIIIHTDDTITDQKFVKLR